MAAANIVAPPPPPTASSEILEGEISRRRRGSRRRHKAPIVCSSGGTTTDGSVCFSDSGGSEEEDDRTGSWRSGGSQEMDLESGELEMEVHYYAAMRRRRRKMKREKKKEEEEERECRICHLNLVGHAENLEMGPGMELGCDCKADLGAAHSHCADTWFKIRGNLTCEICGAIALNVAGEQTMEGNHNDGLAAEPTVATEVHSETLSLSNSRRIMNFLLGCMIVAFIVSWLFHFHKLR